MKKPNLKALGSILCLCLAPLLADVTITGCASDRSEESPGQQIDDALIVRNVKEAFLTDRQYKFEDVKVTALKGTVQLSGFAATGDEKSRAEDIVKNVAGVKDVVNNITVK